MSSVLAAVLAAAALLLVAAGAAKVVAPTRTAGALAALGWPSSSWLVRGGAAGELLLGTATLVVGARVLAMLVAASYLAFALFVMAALRSGTPVGTCGCFGQEDTPPQPRHVVVDGALAAGAVAAAGSGVDPLVDAAWPTWLLAPVLALLAYTSLSATRIPS